LEKFSSQRMTVPAKASACLSLRFVEQQPELKGDSFAGQLTLKLQI
jgi:hypothetical protein